MNKGESIAVPIGVGAIVLKEEGVKDPSLTIMYPALVIHTSGQPHEITPAQSFHISDGRHIRILYETLKSFYEES